MNIVLNGTRVDFKLESEANLFEVLNSIEDWGSENGLILKSFKVNDSEPGFMVKPELEETAVDTIKDLDLTMIGEAEYVFQSAKDLNTFLEKFKNGLAEVDKDEALAALEWIEQSAGKFLDLFKVPNKEQVLSSIKELKIALYNQNEDLINKVGDLESLSAFCKRLVFKTWVYYLKMTVTEKKVTDINLIKDEVKNLVQELINRVAPIAENIQTGRDGEAMSALEDLTEAYQVLILFLKDKDIKEIEVNGKTGEAVLKDIEATLAEIEASLSSEDMVQVSDLIEYEFGEKLSGVSTLIEKL